MASELEELVGFLHSERQDIAQIALQNLIGFSSGPQLEVFATNNFTPIKDIKDLAKSTGRTTANQACTILANLCENLPMRDLIVEDDDFLTFLVREIINIRNPNADIMCILLSNLAKNDHISLVLNITVQHNEEQAKHFKSNRAIDCLMDCFVKGSERTLNKSAEFDYLSYFFADIARFEQGRNYFITQQQYDGVAPISKLLVFTEYYKSKIRREGVASTYKNSLFDTNAHWNLVSNPDINLLPYILLPLAGPEEFDEDDMFNLPEELQFLGPDKKREPIVTIICTHLESLLLLCTTRQMRELMREKSVYAVIKSLNLALDDANVADLCDKCVQLLMRDEAPETIEDVEVEDSDDDEQIIEVL